MLKKILVNKLQLQMHIHKMRGPQIDSPFWHKSFMLEDQATLERIFASSITLVWIDIAKGIDVLTEDMASGLNTSCDTAQDETTQEFSKILAISMDEEVRRAARIIDKSRQAVMRMFQEARMGNAVDTQNAQILVDEIAASVMRNQGALISLARLKTADDYTYMHSVAVCALMIALATQLELDDASIRHAGLAGLLHDLGKVGIKSEILNKPGKLTDAEYVLVKDHPVVGHKILLTTEGIGEIALDVCRHHHEKMDGTGYPDRLSGDQISVYSRMCAVCDVYDAITSNRPYKQAWCPSLSLRKMTSLNKGQFDPAILQAFVETVGFYPVGTLVRLKSDRLGVVLEQQVGISMLQPKVRIFFSTKSMTYIEPELLDLALPDLHDAIVAREDANRWGLKNIEQYWNGNSWQERSGQNGKQRWRRFAKNLVVLSKRYIGLLHQKDPYSG